MKYKFTKALIFIAVLVCIFAFPQIAGAEQFPVEGTNATLTYTVSGSKATITDCNEDATGVLVIPSTIGDNTVVQINTDAFANCALLTAITVPDSVKTIQAQAFKGCTSLEEMTLPFIGESSGGSGYSNCVFGYIFEKSDSSDTSAVKQYPGDGTLYARIPASLKKVTITAETSLARAAFQNCTMLEEVILPAEMNAVMHDNFMQNCTSLKKVNIPKGVGQICNNSFLGCASLESITIPDGAAWIYENAFMDCTSLKEVVLPETLTSIGKKAFYNCTSLVDINIPSKITIIQADTFTNAAFLSDAGKYTDGVLYIDGWVINVDKDVSEVSLIDETTKGIAEKAFAGCASLKKVYIPQSVKKIEVQMFTGCNSLEEMTLPFIGESSGGSGYSNCVFGYIFEKSDSSDTSAVKQYPGDGTLYARIPASLKKVTITAETSLARAAFQNCTMLEEVILPAEMNAVMHDNFMQNCTSLKKVNIPKGVGQICDNSFSGCVSLESITVPDGTAWIDKNAFMDCTSLKEVVLPETLSSIDSKAFYNCTSLVDINIPSKITQIQADTFTDAAFLSDAGKYTDGVLYIDGWVINVDKDVSEVSLIDETTKGIAEKAFAGCASLKKVYIPQSVKKIEAQMFTGCNSLEEMSLPFIGKQKGDYMYNYAVFGYIFEHSSKSDTSAVNQSHGDGTLYALIPSSLKKVTITAESALAIGAFQNCTMLVDINLPESVCSTMRQNFFENCTSLKKINIPSNVTSIDSSAFKNCSSLKEIVLPNGLTSLYSEVFSGCSSLESIVIPSKVTSIPQKTFYGCTNLKSVTVSEGLKFIGEEAFSNCTLLESITLPATLTEIEKLAFEATALLANTANYTDGILYKEGWVLSALENLTAANVKEGTKRIAYGAFGKCSLLKEVTVPDSVVYISKNAFENCAELNKVTLPFIGTKADASYSESVFGAIFGTGSEANGAVKQYYGTRDYTLVMVPKELTEVVITGDYKVPYGAFDNCSMLTNITISDNVDEINQHAFRNCSSLETFVLPSKLKEIQYSVFYNCTNLKSVEIQETVTSIGSYAFYNCKMLEGVTLPQGLKTISSHAFSGCESIKTISVPKSVTAISYNVFEGCTSLEEMTLPFIGGNRATNDNSSAVFGYIFGTANSADGAVTQYFKANSSGNFMIPQSIRKVTITDESVIGYGAFYGCDFIDEIIIESDLSSIGINAFSNLGSEAVDVTIFDRDAIFGDGAVFDNSALVTVYGYRGSTAEAYTSNAGVDFVSIDGGVSGYSWKEYRINSVKIRNSSNAYVDEIPNEKFTLEINLANVNASTEAVLMVVAYDAGNDISDIAIADKFNIEIGSSDVVECIINNVDAAADKVKIFVWSNKRLDPMASAKTIIK